MSQNLGVYFEQLKDPNVAVRVRAVRGLPLLAIALGASEVVSSIFPALGFVAGDVDEVCCALTDVAPELAVLFAREDPEYVSALLPLLEPLAASECMLVLDAAAAALEQVAQRLSAAAFASEYRPMVERFLTPPSAQAPGAPAAPADGRYSPELGVLLIPSLLARATPDEQRAAAQHYGRLVKEYGAVIKNHVALSIRKALAALAPPGTDAPGLDAGVLEELEPVVERLALDPHTVVRKTNLECLLRVAYASNTGANLERFFKAASDNSWQVRLECTALIPMAADVIRATATEHGSIVVSSSLIASAFASLAGDVEIEVQNGLYAALPSFFATLVPLASFPDKFAKPVTALVGRAPDTIGRYIQHAFGVFLARLTAALLTQPAGAKGAALTETALAATLGYLDSPVLDVKLAVLEGLPAVLTLLPADQVVARVVPPIARLLEGAQPAGAAGVNTAYTQAASLTAVKEAAAPVVVQLAGLLSDLVFNDLLLGGVQRWMRDPIWSVRIASARLAAGLVDVYGADWFAKALLGTLAALLKHKDFKVRASSLLVVAAVAQAERLPPKAVAERLAPLVEPLLEDNDNVRCAALEATLAILRRCRDVADCEATCNALAQKAAAIPSGSCREVDRLARLVAREVE